MGVLASVAVDTAGERVTILSAGLLVGDNSGGGVGDGIEMVVVSLAHADSENTSKVKQRGTN